MTDERDKRVESLQKLYREARQIFRDALKRQFPPIEGFDDKAGVIVDQLVDAKRDEQFFRLAGEIVPLLFASDVGSGYAFFHKREILDKVWKIYDDAANGVIGLCDLPEKIEWRKKPPFKIACITGAFHDTIGPAKAIVKFAANLDRKLFEPVVISTNQFFTVRRLLNSPVPGADQKLTNVLAANGIQMMSLYPHDNIVGLTNSLFSLCGELKVDMVVACASLFSFPEACLANSGIAASFFDYHRGFPLYASGIDAICHWVESTRELQLGLWESRGGKILDYHYGIPIPDFTPRSKENQDEVVLITASNHMEKRFSDEFVATITRLLREFPQVRYQMMGRVDPAFIAKIFPSELHAQLELLGSISDESKIYAYLANADIYVNEFPVGGARSVLESMAVGTPVVVMNCGDLPVENTAAEHAGDIAIDEYSAEKYYEFARSLILSIEKRKEIGVKLRKRVEEHYDERKTIKRLSEQMLELHMKKIEAIGNGEKR